MAKAYSFPQLTWCLSLIAACSLYNAYSFIWLLPLCSLNSA